MHKFVVLTLIFAFSHVNASERAVVLVPGIVFDGTSAKDVEDAQSKYWASLMSELRSANNGAQYTIRHDGKSVSVKENCDGPGIAVYSIVFSREAALESLVCRGLELHDMLGTVQSRHRGKITLVGHSAGGLVARVVIQEAVPGITCPENVDHLVTICTPHQGAGLANTFGGLKGLHTLSLQTGAAMIQRLNNLELPQGICFTSIVVSSFGLEASRPGQTFNIPDSLKSDAPRAMTAGGDEVVHIISQNLGFTAAGARYNPNLMNTVLVRGPCSRLLSNSTLHSDILSSKEFCAGCRPIVLGSGTQEDCLNLQVRGLAQTHVAEQIKTFDDGFIRIREVSDVKIRNVSIAGSRVTYTATGSWRSLGNYSKDFTEVVVESKIHPIFGMFAAE